MIGGQEVGEIIPFPVWIFPFPVSKMVGKDSAHKFKETHKYVYALNDSQHYKNIKVKKSL